MNRHLYLTAAGAQVFDLDTMNNYSFKFLQHYIHIGKVCDFDRFGDHCTTDCLHYRQGDCPSKLMRDSLGLLWHVIP